MFNRTRPYVRAIWAYFRGLTLFTQLLLVVPILCGIALLLIVGNMGLALMGTAIPVYSLVVGWFGGLFVLILGKAGIVLAKNK